MGKIIIIIVLIVISIALGALNMIQINQKENLEGEHEKVVSILTDSLKTLEKVYSESLQSQRNACDQQIIQVKDDVLSAVQLEQLHKYYDDLREFREGINEVNVKYISSFEKIGKHLYVTLINNSNRDVSPSYSITFFDRHAMITGRMSDSWWSSMKPGETRIHEEKNIGFYRGEAVYYQVKCGMYSD